MLQAQAALTCIHDASARRRDPTDTGGIRKKFRSSAKLRLRMLLAHMRVAVVDHDALGLTAESGMQYHGKETRLEAFNIWFRQETEKTFVSGGWWQHYVDLGWRAGAHKALEELQSLRVDTTSVAHALQRNKIELQGIGAAIVQSVSRAAADATRYNGNRRYRVTQKLMQAFNKVAQARVVAFTNTSVVGAFNEAKLEIYRLHGVTRVGVIPETTGDSRTVTRDRTLVSQTEEEELGGDDDPSEEYAGVIHNRPKTVEGRAIELEPDALVGVRTAGDNYVCQRCEDYADDAPYELDEVELPLHPNCRCTVYPWEDERYTDE